MSRARAGTTAWRATLTGAAAIPAAHKTDQTEANEMIDRKPQSDAGGNSSRGTQRRRGDGVRALADARVLYVDDDTEVRDQLAQFLRRRVRELHVADDGAAGLESFRRNRPDVVVTDIRMPALDGLKMTRGIRALCEDVPVVVTTAYSEVSELLQAIDLGIARYVLKPIDTDVLLDALEYCARMVRAERGLRLSQAVIDSASEGIVILDPQGRIASLNPAFCAVTGFEHAAVVGEHVSLLLDPDESASVELLSATTTSTWRGEIRMRRADGATFYAMSSIDPVVGPAGAIDYRVLMFFDVTEAKHAREEIHYLAHYDVLTGLPNRRLFDEQLRRALTAAKATSEEIGVLFIDLDQFKAVNDTHGHAIGDLLLREVARRLRGAVREHDLVSRCSGDEFTVLLRQLHGGREAWAIAERVRTSIDAPFDVETRSIAVSCSIGLAFWPGEVEEAQDLLRQADTFMYRAKKDGGNRSYGFDAMQAAGELPVPPAAADAAADRSVISDGEG